MADDQYLDPCLALVPIGVVNISHDSWFDRGTGAFFLVFAGAGLAGWYGLTVGTIRTIEATPDTTVESRRQILATLETRLAKYPALVTITLAAVLAVAILFR